MADGHRYVHPSDRTGNGMADGHRYAFSPDRNGNTMADGHQYVFPLDQAMASSHRQMLGPVKTGRILADGIRSVDKQPQHQPRRQSITTSPPGYDFTFAKDHAAAQDREYVDWCRVLENDGEANQGGTRETKPEQSLEMDKLAERYAFLKDLPIDSYHRVNPHILIGVDNWRLGKPLNDGESLDAALKEHYTIKTVGISNFSPLESKEDQRAKALLATETILLHRRYQTALLWKYDDVRLPCNKEMALKRYACLKNKMAKDPAYLAIAITQKMKESEETGYSRKM
uniref:Uncharacterized protein n=1 Tax=Anopheles christyi TaxID=43041 RepID=A0A182KAE6_9DIPT